MSSEEIQPAAATNATPEGPTRSALVVVDVQEGFNDPSWGQRNNPACEANIAALLAAWRRTGEPIVFVRHDSQSAGSPLLTGQPGNDLQPLLTGDPDLLVTKSVNSAFHGSPDLHAWLVAQGLNRIVVCGITTNHCCETTARVGGNLGLDVTFVIDATYTFDRTGPDGVTIDADTLSRVTATNLHDEFADVVSTDDVLERARPSSDPR
jgi:nicotinamidase-related amidase